MKKIISFFLLLTMLFAFSGCKNAKQKESAYALKQESEDTGALENTDVLEDDGNKDDDTAQGDASDEKIEKDEQPTVEKADGTENRAQVNVSDNKPEKDDNNATPAPDDTQQSYPPTSDMLIETPKFDQAISTSNDIFIGEIVAASPITQKVEFDNVDITGSTPKLYLVKVVDVLKGQVVTADSVIRVVHFVIESNGDESWVKDYEIGKQYLIGGRVQPFDEKPILLDNSRITSEVDKNGNFTPISKTAQTVFEKVKTLNELLTYKNDPVVWTGREGDIAEKLFESVKQNTNAYEKITLNTVIDYLKEAIKTDSDVTLTVSPPSSEQVG